MALRWPFSRAKIEKRASGGGFTSEIMAARESYISGRRGIAELTATAQACISLWEGGLCMADVKGTELLTRSAMAMMGRSLALRGEMLFVIDGKHLVPCSDWELSTRNARPVAYRLSISESGGARTRVVLAAEVIHVRVGCDPAAPWLGTAPLRRATLTAGLLNAVEGALGEVFDHAPLGSQIVPFPESPETDMTTLGRGFRGQRGRVLLRESVHVTAAGGPSPAADWRPADVTPDISKAMTKETLEAARAAICAAFGVLPAMFATNAQGPLVREAQRHMSQWVLEPIAELIAQEATEKLGTVIELDTTRPLQAFDAGGRARALATVVESMAKAKEAGLPAEAFASALRLVDLES